MPESDPHAIVLFDGVCNFCNSTVNFIIRNDRRGYFTFAPLQSEGGARLQAEHGFDPSRLDTFIVIERGTAYDRSTAALRIARRLGGAYPLAYAFIAVPRPVRDFVYDWFAKGRYRWFGKRDECMVPDEGIRARFLTD
jgi:predicted DCC family thiol-disulfide oxidoreductase YuxK